MRQEFMLSCCCSVIFGQLIKQLQPRAERERERSLSTSVRCGCSAVYCSRSHPLYTYHISNCSQENGREGRGREGNVARLPVNHM